MKRSDYKQASDLLSADEHQQCDDRVNGYIDDMGLTIKKSMQKAILFVMHHCLLPTPCIDEQ